MDALGAFRWKELGGRAAKGMINQDTRRGLSFGIRGPETFKLQIGVDRQIRCQKAGKIRSRSRRHFRRTKRGNIDGYGLEFAGFVLFCVLAWRASGAVSPSCLRHVAVNHSIVLVLSSGVEVKRRHTEKEQKQ